MDSEDRALKDSTSPGLRLMEATEGGISVLFLTSGSSCADPNQCYSIQELGLIGIPIAWSLSPQLEMSGPGRIN